MWGESGTRVRCDEIGVVSAIEGEVEESPLGGPASFGHPGRGGSPGFGDPESGVAFGYVVSHIRQDLNDNRAALLVQAVRACLE
jgi:CubicO group peptidase (beta-lactamase class C family)